MKKAILFAAALALCLTGCGEGPGAEAGPEQIISTVSPEDCFLCGNGAGEPFYWGQNNVGILSLNSFEVLPLEINRYDEHGALIEESAGHVRAGGFQDSENGFSAYVVISPDNGYALEQLSFQEDRELHAEKAAAFLCQDCLDKVLSEIHGGALGVGVINFSTKEIRVLDKSSSAFGLGDYYIHMCSWDEQDEAADTQDIALLVFFHPPRYEENESAS